MAKKNIPAISIVIPMYNAEKYIEECLDSIFAQTFQNFEVLLIDDCSTDNSVAIVENYLKRGGGAISEKLQFIKRKSDSGGASVPRNTGLKYATGEYVIFVDGDDAITPTALEEIYPIAKNFNADIVFFEKHYQTSQEKITEDIASHKICFSATFAQVTQATPVHNQTAPVYENLAERLAAFANSKMPTTPWNYLFRRKIIAENDIKFPTIKHGEDEVFDFHALCASKNVVCIPNVFYIYRVRPDSSVHKTLSVERYISDWYSSIFKAIGILDEIMSKFKFFEENPEYKYLIFDSYTRKNVIAAPQIYSQIPAGRIDKLIRREIEPIKDKTSLAAFLFARMNIFNANILQQQNTIRQLQAQIQQLKQNPYSL